MTNPDTSLSVLADAIKNGVSLNTASYVLLALASSLGGLLGAFLNSYYSERGKNRAMKADLNDLIRISKEQVSATESVRASISNELWVKQKRWDLKKELYSELLDNLGVARRATDQLFGIHDTPEPELLEAIERLKKKKAELWKIESQAVEKIRQVGYVAGMFLTPAAIAALEKLEREWRKADDEHTEFGMIDSRFVAADNAYKLLNAAAKQDLLTEPTQRVT